MLVRAHLVVSGLDKHGYYHGLFLRGHPELVNRIPRVPIKDAGPRRPASVDTEPNFYALPYIGDETMAVARAALPTERTTRERLLQSQATELNPSVWLMNGGGAQHRGDILTALQNARASQSAAWLPQPAVAHIPDLAMTNVMETLSVDAAVLAMRRQQRLDQDRIPASLIPTRSIDRLPSGIDLSSLFQMQNHRAHQLGLPERAIVAPQLTD
jgi:hypothetical protein